ncbi:MAG: fimbrial protein [Parabacteroides gordonii]|uniref:fimbrial protein n=1 Tax=Parabacteroides gordonii TaxID=574930 RepID=UPI003A8C3E4E
MKLRNLLYATMIACAFASCSNDDDPIDNGSGNNANTDATLSVKYETPVITRSGNTEGQDNTITSLNVYVFNGTGTNAKLEVIGTLTDGSANESKNIKVSAGDKSIVVVANAAPEMSVNSSTLQDLYDAEKEFGASEKNGTISMNSRTYVVSVIAGETNYLGYTKDQATDGIYLIPTNATGGDLENAAVKLYRNVAKINLQKISVDTEKSKNEYSNAKFILSDVFILHAGKMTKIVGGANPWNSTEVKVGQSWLNGPENTTYVEWVTTITEWLDAHSDAVSKKPYLTGGYVGNLKPFQTSPISEDIADGETYPEQADETSSIDYFYAYENTTATHTLLVVKGKFVYGENAVEANFPERYYSVSVGRDGMGAVTPPAGGITRSENGVLRNLQYNIALTIQGPGWETPFGPDGGENTALDVKVEVVDFSYVNQVVEIE